jgi:hypothetical protein
MLAAAAPVSTAPSAAAAAAAPSAAGPVVHISPLGSDTSGDGSATQPFFSPTRARDAIRVIRAARSGSTSGFASSSTSATVILAGGIYHLGGLGTLQLTAQDSNTRWVAGSTDREQQPMLSGAIALGNLSWSPFNSSGAGAGSILQADLPAQLLGGLRFATLFDESAGAAPAAAAGRRLVRARHPNGETPPSFRTIQLPTRTNQLAVTPDR